MRKIIIDSLCGNVSAALTENGELVEFIPSSKNSFAVGNIYSGRVEKILPSKFAFVNIGADKNAFLQLSDKKQESLYEIDERSGKKRLKIKQGDNILVQIERMGNELKGAAVTVNLSFTGKYVVLIAGQDGIGISKKINDNELCISLKKTAREVLPEGYALIMRTSCVSADMEDIKKEIKSLHEKSVEIIQNGRFIKPPHIIYRAENEIEALIRDFIRDNDDEIVLNEKNIFKYYSKKIDIGKAVLFENDVPMLEYYGIRDKLEKALKSKVWLKSGGFLIIEETEACTVVDVNSGKFTGKDKRKTFLKTNLEAAKEIARQIRLRNISGMIIIDFIDMPDFQDRETVCDSLKSFVNLDRINTTIVGMTELGLMQLTRKKTRNSLSKELTAICPHCMGSGRIENEDFVCSRIRDRICSIFSSTVYNCVTVSSNKRIIDAFKGENNEYKRIEEKYGKLIKFNVISTQKLDYFEIEKEKI